MSANLKMFYVAQRDYPDQWKILLARDDDDARELSNYLHPGQVEELQIAIVQDDDNERGDVLLECRPATEDES